MPGLETPEIPTLIAVAAVMVVAGLVHGTLGLGFPLVATPVLASLTDVRSAILVTLLPTVAVNVVSILRGGEWRHSIGRYWPVAAFALLGSVIGTRLLIAGDPSPFKLALALIILAYLGIERAKQLRLSWVARYPVVSYPVFGLGAGLLAGTVNVMVPALIIFTLELNLAPLVMVQVFNLCFMAGKLAQIGTFWQAGAIDAASVASTVPLAAIALVALYAGMRLRDRIDAATYRGWIRRVLAGIAVLLIAQFALAYV